MVRYGAVQVRQALAAGEMTHEDVLQFEKLVGVDVGQLARLVETGQIDKRKLKELGPDFASIVDLFKQLAKVKQSG